MCACLVGIVATLVLAPAALANEVLFLRDEEGGPAAKASNSEVQLAEVRPAKCSGGQMGGGIKTLTNLKKKDKLTLEMPLFTCSWVGTLKSVELTTLGKVTATAKPHFRAPVFCGLAKCEEEDPENPFCYYEVPKLQGNAVLPGSIVDVPISGVGKLSKTISPRACPGRSQVTLEAEFTGWAEVGPYLEFLYAETI